MGFLCATMAVFGLIFSITAQEIGIPPAATVVGQNIHGDNITYNVVPTVWNLEHPGVIPNHTFTGTVEELYEYVSTNFPDYDWPLDHFDASASRDEPYTLPHIPGKIICGNFPAAYWFRVYDGYTYLRGVPGQPRLAAGPKVCARISCSFHVAIFVCNDNIEDYYVSSFRIISDMVQQIGMVPKEGGCRFDIPTRGPWTSGQYFHEDNWNVVVTSISQNDEC